MYIHIRAQDGFTHETKMEERGNARGYVSGRLEQ